MLSLAIVPANALADGRGILRCDSCATVNDFSSAAQSFVSLHTTPYDPGFQHFHFVLLNPGAKLLAQVMVTHHYDPETGLSGTHTIALTGTIANMREAYKVAIPGFGMTFVPAGVATTYTGSTQQAAVGAYLQSYYASSSPSPGTTTLAVFPDYSSAVYQDTGDTSYDWTMISGSGHGQDGTPMDDSGNFVTTTPPSGTILTPPSITAAGGTVGMHGGGGGYGVDIFGIAMWVNGVIYCMVDGCTRISGS